jgi:5-methylcytosine-specific restriction protein A
MRAPKICGYQGCSDLAYDGGTYCERHRREREGKWRKRSGTSRTGTAEHKARRLRILHRDPWCRLKYGGCQGASVICDHIIPLAAGGADEDWNCQGACQSCSDKKTSQEAHYMAGHNVPCPWAGAPTTPPPMQAPRAIRFALSAHTKRAAAQRKSSRVPASIQAPHRSQGRSADTAEVIACTHETLNSAIHS